MAFARFEAVQRLEAEAGAEPVEQRSQAPTPTLPRLRGRGTRRVSGGREGAFDLLGRQGLDGEDREDHVFDPEPGIDRVELRGEESGQVARVAVGPGGAERDMLDPAVDAVK